MSSTKEQQKKMLEAIGKRNESIELLGKSFGEGMKKLDEQADNLLEKMGAIKKESNKLVKRKYFMTNNISNHIEAVVRKIPYRLKFVKNVLYEPLLNYTQQQKYISYEAEIKKYKDIHKGERCFLIGTGPSLNNTDFSLIKDEILFSVNRFYEGFEKFNVTCKYMGLGDEQLFDDIYGKFLSVDAELFIVGEAGRHFFKKPDFFKSFVKNKVTVIRGRGNIHNDYNANAVKGLYSGATIIVECLQIAMHMGFDEVYLLGCDCDYSGVHHFHGGKNIHVARDKKRDAYVSSMTPIYQMFNAYKMIRKRYEDHGQSVYNATVGGKLEVFERRKLEDVI